MTDPTVELRLVGAPEHLEAVAAAITALLGSAGFTVAVRPAYRGRKPGGDYLQRGIIGLPAGQPPVRAQAFVHRGGTAALPAGGDGPALGGGAR